MRKFILVASAALLVGGPIQASNAGGRVKRVTRSQQVKSGNGDKRAARSVHAARGARVRRAAKELVSYARPIKPGRTLLGAPKPVKYSYGSKTKLVRGIYSAKRDGKSITLIESPKNMTVSQALNFYEKRGANGDLKVLGTWDGGIAVELAPSMSVEELARTNRYATQIKNKSRSEQMGDKINILGEAIIEYSPGKVIADRVKLTASNASLAITRPTIRLVKYVTRTSSKMYRGFFGGIAAGGIAVKSGAVELGNRFTNFAKAADARIGLEMAKASTAIGKVARKMNRFAGLKLSFNGILPTLRPKQLKVSVEKVAVAIEGTGIGLVGEATLLRQVNTDVVLNADAALLQAGEEIFVDGGNVWISPTLKGKSQAETLAAYAKAASLGGPEPLGVTTAVKGPVFARGVGKSIVTRPIAGAIPTQKWNTLKLSRQEQLKVKQTAMTLAEAGIAPEQLLIVKTALGPEVRFANLRGFGERNTRSQSDVVATVEAFFSPSTK